MKIKPLLCPQRLRLAPRQFSWIDQRLVRHGHITRCGPQALALYLLLLTVADAQGMSYYSDATTARLLSMSAEQLRQARAQLLTAGLIAYESPFYQVLSLEPDKAPAAPASQGPRGGAAPAEPRPLGEILHQILEQARQGQP